MRPLDREALLRALHPDGAVFAAWAAERGAAVDWSTVERRATAHKVAALLAARLAASGLDGGLDQRLRQRLDAARADAVRRGQAAERTLAALGEAFGAAGVPFFIVKGSALAHRVYGDPHLRRFADVDVVVRRADVDRAEAALRAMAYRPGGFESILGLSLKPDDPRHARAVTLVRGFEGRELAAYTWYAPSAELLSVDLHWHVSPWRLRVGEEAVWAATEPLAIGGTTARTLAPPATLIHLVAHATTSLFNGFRLLHLCDVAWAARRFADQADDVWRLAREWRVADHLARVFRMVERALGVDLPLAAGAPPAGARPGFATVADAAFLVDATELKSRPALQRLRSELLWAVAMGCLRRNVNVVADVSITRALF